MKPEVLLKAFVLHQSEDGFRELVATTVDDVYSRALRIIHGPPHLVEETVLRVYWELARKAPRLGDDVIVTDWLREHTCKTAVKILREENRALDREALEKEKESPASPKESEIAPPGLALRVSQGILLNAACNKSIWRFVPRNPLPAWIRPVHFGAVAACVLALIIVWKNPFHKRNPIVLSPQTQLQLTPVSFGQLASSEEGFSPPSADTPNTNAGNNQSPP